MNDGETDPRVVAYTEAMLVNDIDDLICLRLLHPELITRFHTVEQAYAGLLKVYEREIQILRLEVSGWKGIVDGQDSGDERAVVQGLEKCERALMFRKNQPVVCEFEKLAKTV